MSARFVAGTIVAKNYVAYARAWARSLRERHPDARVVVLLTDRNDGTLDPAAEPFDLVEVEDLGIPGFASMAFRYDVMELSTAVKPAFLEHLLATGDEEAALYFDPDILVLSPLDPMLGALGRANVVLTPHALAPVPVDGKRPSEAAFLVSGTYNLGFIGVRRSDESARMLGWWKDRLVRGGASAPEKGLFTDQKWIDLVPAFFDGVEILRDPTLNVAYWNLHERGEITRSGASFLVGGAPIGFFHFSGFVPDRPELVSKHQDRFRAEDLSEAARELFAAYGEAIRREGHEGARSLPYAFGKFSDGEPVPRAMRAAFRAAESEGLAWSDPFDPGEGAFREWALKPGVGQALLPPFARAIWESRPDVRAVFPLGRGDQAAAVLEWILGPGGSAAGFGPAVREGLESALARVGRSPSRASARGSARPGPIRTLWRFLRTDPALHPDERSGYEASPGTGANRLLQRLLGTTVYRRLRFYLWCRRFHPSRIPMPLRSSEGEFAPDASRRAGPATITPVEAPFGVNLFGYLDTESGIAEVARCFVRMLEREGVPVAPVVVPQDWLRREDRTIARPALTTPFPVNLFFVNADQLPAVLSSRRALLDGRRTVGYWFWELEEFPGRFDGALRLVDEVWVASSFCQKAIAARADVPVVRVPPELRDEGWPGPDRRRFDLADEDFVFLYVFDAASFLRRKNPGAAIAAFRRAFPVPGRELLVLKTTSASERQVRALERIARGSRVRVVNGYASREELLALHASADACLSLHRSEGLGLTLLEAMAYRKPVVSTAYGGCEDFLRPDSAMLVPYRRVPVGRAAGPYPADALWAEPDVETAARAMRKLAEDPSEAMRVGAAGRQVFEEWARGSGPLLRRRIEKLSAGRFLDG